MKQLVSEIRSIIESTRTNAVRSVDFCRVQMYWQIGRRIVEEEQGGQARAEYGKSLIKNLAKEIEPEFGSGFGQRQLERARQFYIEFPIASTLRTQFNWSQYKLLIGIADKDKREYYELEAANNCWTARQMQRQINSMLYERMLLSNDKEAVFYNRLARRFVVFELKTGEVTHQDLGQLQMYVNYYDRTEKLPEESPTIGILLCTGKNDTLVKMTLPADNNTIV
ncbi:MAG: PDDEXK nuclease domain-containing protein, partial [Muribaculaceae bacterium]|nr:PDDEXK nuclease domain-containing protein [Muribaculaceae bacterium]